MRVRERRIPESFLRETFRYLDRAGVLAVVLGHLEDLRDIRQGRLEQLLTTADLTDPKMLSEIQKTQGALEENERLQRDFRLLAEPESAAPARPESLAVRPQTVRVRKRAVGRS